MNRFSYFVRKLGILFRREGFNRDMADEMAFHLEQSEKDLVAGGVSADEAHYAARRQFGNDGPIRAESQKVTGFWFESVLQDVRFALRQLMKSPGFSVTAIATLALGICASVAIFAFVDAAMIKPLPYRDPAKLVGLYESIPLGPRYHLSWPDLLDWRAGNTSFSSLEVYENFGYMLTTSEGGFQAAGARVSDGFFKTLGVTPILGRDFLPGETEPAAARVVILSYRAWQKRYGGKSDVLGKTVILDEIPMTIVGVLPEDFHFAPAEPAEFWSTDLLVNRTCRGCHSMYGVARLKDGVSFETAYANMKAIAQQLAVKYPENHDQGAYMLPLTQIIAGDIRPVLVILLSGAALLLLIACANVASLLLVRSENRKREIAIRSALGATPGRLVRQFITEGLALVAIGSTIGVGVAFWLIQVLARLVPKNMIDSMPFLLGVGLSTRVVLFSLAASGVAALLFSLTPTLRVRFGKVRDDLAEGGRTAAGAGWRRLGANLVVVELAAAMLLLASAGLLARSFYHLLQVEIGMQPDHVAVLTLSAPDKRYPKDENQVALSRNIADKVAHLPGIVSVGICDTLPLGDADGTSTFVIVGQPRDGKNREVTARAVSAGYFSTLKTPLVSGRYFLPGEDRTKPNVVIINKALADKFLPGENPIGKQMNYDGATATSIMQIVGVVAEVKEGQLDYEPRPAFYRPFDQEPGTSFSVVARTVQDPQLLLPELAGVVRQIDPSIAAYGANTMQERLHNSIAAYLHRSAAWLVGGFAALALLLGVVGLYGVIAYSVSQRTREIGVRMALGAQRGSIYSLVLKEAGWLITLGTVIGIACSLGAANFLHTLLFGVRSWDLGNLLTVACVLAVAALVASYIPARRAASANPIDALRNE
jgi:macrolide transport system ATP-binding/permease protein